MLKFRYSDFADIVFIVPFLIVALELFVYCIAQLIYYITDKRSKDD
jgi:hypothetical protein